MLQQFFRYLSYIAKIETFYFHRTGRLNPSADKVLIDEDLIGEGFIYLLHFGEPSADWYTNALRFTIRINDFDIYEKEARSRLGAKIFLRKVSKDDHLYVHVRNTNSTNAFNYFFIMQGFYYAK